jgi:hypothetical protein
MHRRYFSAIVLVIVLLAGCAPTLPPADSGLNPTFAAPAPEPTMTRPASIPSTGDETPLKPVVEDLSRRLNVPLSDIEVVAQEAVTWPDGGLGCPQPGMNYIQVPVDGLRIVLSHAGTNYEYHTGESTFVLCEIDVPEPALTPIPFKPGMALTPELEMTATLPIEFGLEQYVDAAVSDLAARLSIDPGTIEVVSAQTVEWPDGGLGCPKPGMAYIQVQVDGYRIELRVENQLYAYHGGEGRRPFLCENPSK